MTDEEKAIFDERAGIREYDGGMTRAQAERLAMGDLERIMEKKDK